MHQSGSYSGSKCMDEQAVWPLADDVTMTVGPSAPPIVHIADAALPHGAIIPHGFSGFERSFTDISSIGISGEIS